MGNVAKGIIGDVALRQRQRAKVATPSPQYREYVHSGDRLPVCS